MLILISCSSVAAAERQPRPRARRQAHGDRRLGRLGEAQRRPDDNQEAHREDGGGELSVTSDLCCSASREVK